MTESIQPPFWKGEDQTRYETEIPSPDIIQFAIDVSHLIGELPSIKTREACRLVMLVRATEAGLRQSGQMTGSFRDLLDRGTVHVDAERE